MFECYLIDVEGTIVTDKSYTPIAGAIDWLNRLHSSGKNFCLVTNNTTHKPKDLLALLWRIGFELDEKNLHSCLSVALNWLKENRTENCFVLGSNGLKKFLKENGIKLNNENIQAVLVGLDEKLNYNKLKIATSGLIKDDAFLLALHANRIYKDKNGQIAPSVGAVVKALEYATGKKALVLGKPSETFYLAVLNRLSSLPEKTLMISDDPFSDLLGAKKLGMKTAFVLSGKYRDKDILNEIETRFYPDFVYDNITQIEMRSI